MEAQRYPEDFDGLIIGAPVLDFTGTVLSGIWHGQALSGGGLFTLGKLPLLAEAVYTQYTMRLPRRAG